MGLNYQVKLWIIKGVFYMQLEMQFYCSEIVALLVVGGGWISSLHIYPLSKCTGSANLCDVFRDMHLPDIIYYSI